MANTKISALTSGNPAQSGDLIPIDRAGSNFSITGGSLATLATSGLAAIATSGAWSDLQNAAAALTLSNGGNATTFNHTSAINWTIANTTAATSGVSQSSPIFILGGQYWNGSASASDTWSIQSQINTGTNGWSWLTTTHSGSTSSGFVLPLNILLSTNVLYSGTQASPVIAGALSATTAQGLYFGPYFTSRNPLFLGLMSASGGSITTNNYIGVNFINTAIGNTVVTGPYQGTTVGGLQTHVAETSTFSPASGSTNFVAHLISPTINQTGTASGGYTALKINAIETAVLGSGPNMLLDLQVGGTRQIGFTNKTHVITGAANNDFAGVISSASGTTVSYTYAVAFTSTPVVVVTPTTNAGAYFLSASTNTGFTITYATAGAQTFNYIIVGNPN